MEIVDQQDATSYEIDQEEQGGENQSAARSYECTFCKRGFTNAQALGGHMNIHRKEKAKIKQSTSAPSFSSNKMVVDTLKMIIPTPARLPWAVSTSTAENYGRSRGGEETLIIGEEVQQLQLFVEKPSNTNQKLEIHQVLSSEVVSNSSLQLSSVVSELDLELRLGFEPRNSTPSSSPTGSTRHFF